MNREDAEEFTQSLGQILGGGWRQIAWADRQGIPAALGLSTEDWVNQRLGGYARVAVSERREASRELTAPLDEGGQGMTQREAAEVLGVDPATVNRDLKPEPVANATPEPEPKPAGAHVGKNSGDNEWYTPAEYVKAAAAVMGGIDLDPASSAAANEVIEAAQFFSEDDDGLTKPWAGRVWMNPPYAQPLIDRFCTRIAREFVGGNVTEACVLVNNGTETGWFQAVAAQASAICFPRGRVRFWHPGKESASPLQGQAVLYLGPNAAGFRAEFLRFGFVVAR